jgi:hypothetical protein
MTRGKRKRAREFAAKRQQELPLAKKPVDPPNQSPGGTPNHDPAPKPRLSEILAGLARRWVRLKPR